LPRPARLLIGAAPALIGARREPPGPFFAYTGTSATAYRGGIVGTAAQPTVRGALPYTVIADGAAERVGQTAGTPPLTGPPWISNVQNGASQDHREQTLASMRLIWRSEDEPCAHSARRIGGGGSRCQRCRGGFPVRSGTGRFRPRL